MFDTTTAEDFFGADYDFDKTVITDKLQVMRFIGEMIGAGDTYIRERGEVDERMATRHAAVRANEGLCRVADIVVFDDDNTAMYAFTGDMSPDEAYEFIYAFTGDMSPDEAYKFIHRGMA